MAGVVVDVTVVVVDGGIVVIKALQVRQHPLRLNGSSHVFKVHPGYRSPYSHPKV